MAAIPIRNCQIPIRESSVHQASRFHLLVAVSSVNQRLATDAVNARAPWQGYDKLCAQGSRNVSLPEVAMSMIQSILVSAGSSASKVVMRKHAAVSVDDKP
jgi:hypothetical protein